MIPFQTDSTAVVALLKRCAHRKDMAMCENIHADLVQMNFLAEDMYVGSALTSAYAKCGALDRAVEVFSQVRYRDAICWNGLIAGFAQHERGEEALSYFQRMRQESLSPDAVTFVCALKACNNVGSTSKGKEIHAHVVVKDWLRKNVFVGNALVDMYAKLGAMAKAEKVFFELPIRDVVSWTALIGAYAQHGHDEAALYCLQKMQAECVLPNAVTFTCCLKACANLGMLENGIEMHSEIVRMGLGNNVLIGTTLVAMYVKCGALIKARELFRNLPTHDVASWNALITGYVLHGHAIESLSFFELMQHNGFSPDAVTFICVLKACGDLVYIDKGAEVHAEICRKGWILKHTSLGNALVDMYAKFGMLKKAQSIFEELSFKDTVTWTTLIAGYVEHGDYMEVLYCYGRLKHDGISANEVTIVCVLKACSNMGLLEKGKEIHADIVKAELLKKDLLVGTALVDLYSKCGEVAESREIFNKLLVRDVAAWNALIAGFSENENGREALNSFSRMQLESVSPTTFTFSCMLKACGDMGAIAKGKEFHAEIVEEGSDKNEDCLIENALIDMYAKCGLPTIAEKVFDDLPVHTVVSWTALISGYGQFGEADYVIHLFKKMIGEGIEPDHITLTVMLNACSHSGLLDMGCMYFETMCRIYGMIPTMEHYASMVDLFGRAGQIHYCIAVILGMSAQDSLSMWISILGVCTKQGNVELGRESLERMAGQSGLTGAAYASMRNIVATAIHGEWL